jgi:hypothetical protein
MRTGIQGLHDHEDFYTLYDQKVFAIMVVTKDATAGGYRDATVLLEC